MEKPFCRLLYFDRKLTRPLRAPQPRVLIRRADVGHYATLLRGTVEAFLPTHEVYTHRLVVRMVPLTEGRFDLDGLCRLHHRDAARAGATCTSRGVPVHAGGAAVSVMEAERDPFVPVSMTLMGGPIDTRRNPTAPTISPRARIDWFALTSSPRMPFPHPGVMRNVYPGFLQLSASSA